MLINKYDTFCTGAMSNTGVSTSIAGSVLNVLANNYVVIQNYDLFNENTLTEVIENPTLKK